MPASRIVLDTSVFTNPDSSMHWGEDRDAAFTRFVAIARALEGTVRFFMPRTILEELRTFMGGSLPDSEFELVIDVRSPDRFGQTVPGMLLYELIDELRGRIDRGLRVAERHVRHEHPEGAELGVGEVRPEHALGFQGVGAAGPAKVIDGGIGERDPPPNARPESRVRGPLRKLANGSRAPAHNSCTPTRWSERWDRLSRIPRNRRLRCCAAGQGSPQTLNISTFRTEGFTSRGSTGPGRCSR